MTGFIILATFVGIVIVAFASVVQKRLADSVVFLMGVGLGNVVLFFLFKAPDVALTEAVIGAGIGTFIFLIALKHLGEQA